MNDSMLPAEPRRPRVWVADDVALEGEAARRILSVAYDIELFSDGSAVLERASTGELPDLLVLDWHMPGVSGIEVCRFLRANPDSVGVPILVFTSTGDEQDMLESLAAGADDYVGKAASAQELLARAGSLVRSKLLRDRAETAERRLAALLVSEREARADAEAANRAKDLFLATVSHELRTPLNAILGWARLLRGGGLTEDKTVRALETIERNARVQTQIVDDLLDLSRIITGKLRLDLVPLDPGDVVEQVVESVRPSAASKRITLTTSVARGTSIAGDASRLQQIVSNLISNAIKFTPSGGTVDVSLASRDHEVVLRVTDSGIGIAPEVATHVFDRFRQGDSTMTRTHGGLGLGLAIVRQLVELHGGRARVESAGLGHGAMFEVSFPTHTAVTRAGRGGALEPSDTGQRTDVHGMVVLVVDDDPDGLEIVRDLLEREGAQVRAATSAKDALAILEREVPGVIVSDISMPEMDGYELIRAVHQRLGGRWVPAIALTAHAREEDRWASLGAGYQVHLTKPIDAHQLLTTIARLGRAADEMGGRNVDQPSGGE